MTFGLTHQQASLVAFIENYAERHGGASPSFAEMAVAMGNSSKSTVYRMVELLEQRGVIRHKKGARRSIAVCRVNLRHISTGDLIAELDRRSALPAYVDTHEGLSA